MERGSGRRYLHFISATGLVVVMISASMAVFPLAVSGGAMAQPDSPECRKPATEEERQLIGQVDEMISSLGKLLDTLRSQQAELEAEIRAGRAHAQVLRIYRETRQQVASAERQQEEARMLAAKWCKP